MRHPLVQLSFHFDPNILTSDSEGMRDVAIDLSIFEVEFTDLGVGRKVEGWQNQIL